MKRILSFIKSDVGRIVIASILFISALILEQKANEYVALCFYIAALAASGCRVFIDAVKGILRLDPFDE